MTRGIEPRPRLAIGVRLRRDTVREHDVLLYPEGAVTLNQTAAAVLALCDGDRTLDQIVSTLSRQFADADVRADVEQLLADMSELGMVVDAAG
jgi:pyrroloquinoline quinone biosynthesis protein D